MRGKVLHAGQVSARSLGMFWILWRISSAQTPGTITSIPTEMQGDFTIPAMRSHFCQGFTTQPTSDMPRKGDPFCLQISRTDNAALNRQCWSNLANGLIDSDRPNCKAHQELYCQYIDAVVCQYTSPGRMTPTLGSCVYHSGRDEPFCICENDEGMWPTTGHDRESRCSEFETTTTTHPTSSGLERDQDVNVVAIVLGCILSLLLLVIIIGVVILYLRRQGKLSSLGRKRSKCGDKSPSTDDVSGMNDYNRAPMPEPLVLGAVEYSYAYDRRPSEPTNKPKTGEPKSDDQNHYYSISDEQGNQRYVSVSAPSTSREGPSSREAPDDHPYHVLERPDVSEDAQSEDGEFGPSSPEPASSPKEASDDTYFPLMPTSPPPSGYETLAVAPGADVGDASSPYDHIDRDRTKLSNKEASQNGGDGTSNANYDRITPNGGNNKEK